MRVTVPTETNLPSDLVLSSVYEIYLFLMFFETSPRTYRRYDITLDGVPIRIRNIIPMETVFRGMGMYRDDVGDGLPADLDPQAFYTVQYMHVNDPFRSDAFPALPPEHSGQAPPPRENKMVRQITVNNQGDDYNGRTHHLLQLIMRR